MKRIANYPLWIGHAGDARDDSALHAAGIRAVVQLALEEPSPTLGREFIFYRFPLLDGDGNDPVVLRLAIRSVDELLRQGVPTLVWCSGGMSRSPAIVAAALSRFEGVPLEHALRQVADSGPSDISPALWKGICDAVGR